VKVYAIAGGAGVAGFLVFVVLAQTHTVFVPHFTPVVLKVDGLRTEYRVGEDVNFMVSVEGYGSNCHMLQVEALGVENERVSFYRRADDCRFMTITHGQYNMTRVFDYGGRTILDGEGTYNLYVQFEDLIDGTKTSTTRTFTVSQ
jgi:hypothetical protein